LQSDDGTKIPQYCKYDEKARKEKSPVKEKKATIGIISVIKVEELIKA